jgi:hypothetical protein
MVIYHFRGKYFIYSKIKIAMVYNTSSLTLYFQGCHIACIGEGPVVHISPQSLDWGIIPVLTDKPMTLVLSNEYLSPLEISL